MLDKGARYVDSTDSTGRTPLLYAAASGEWSVCRPLLHKGANVDSTDSTGRTPLSYAAAGRNADICKLLLDKGANVDSTDSTGWTPLSDMAAGRNADIFRLLLDKGANVNPWNFTTDHTPLLYIGEVSACYTCRLLLDNGANVDSADPAGRTPLSYAAAGESQDICRTTVPKWTHPTRLAGYHYHMRWLITQTWISIGYCCTTVLI